MKGFLFRIFILSCLIYSCSSDSDNPSLSIATDITVIGSKDAIVYQADITNGESITVYNLTQELGLPDSSIRFYSRDYYPMIHFYHGPSIFEINKTWEKNLVNGNHSDFEIPCNPLENRVSSGPVTYDDNIFWLKTVFEGNQTTISLEAFDKLSNECHSINLGTTLSSSSLNAFAFYDGKLLVSYTNELRNTVLLKVNTSNYSIENQVIIEGLCGITLREDRIYCFLNSSSRQYFEYNFDTFQLVRTSNFTTSSPYFFGVLETSFDGDRMLIFQEAAQPSPIKWIPVIYNLNDGSIEKQVDSFLIGNNLQALEGMENRSIEISSVKFGADLKKGILVGGFEYFIGQGQERAYGIFLSDFDSNILKTIDLDFQPGDIIIN